jgi:hypothetical protein
MAEPLTTAAVIVGVLSAFKVIDYWIGKRKEKEKPFCASPFNGATALLTERHEAQMAALERIEQALGRIEVTLARLEARK